jgi:PAS domain S-box-containing protein
LHYRKSLELANEIGNKNLKTVINKNLGILLIRQKKYDEAIFYLQKSLALSQETNQKTFLVETYYLLSEVYNNIGNVVLSYENYKLYSNLKDSLFNKEIGKKLGDIEEKYHQKEKFTELQLLKADEERKFRKVIYVIAAFILIIATFIFYFLFIQKRKYAKSLEIEINNRKKIQEKLNSEQELFNIMLETSSDLIYFKDLESRYIKVSKSLVDWLNVNEQSDILGKTDYDFYEKEYADKNLYEENNLIKTGKAISGNIEREANLSGKTRWVSTNKLPLYDNSGKNTGVFGISRDITLIKEAEDALRQSEEKLRYIFDNAPIGIIIIDTKGNILDVNPYLVEILGSPSVDYTKQINVLKFPLLLSAGISRDFEKCVLEGENIFTGKKYTSNWGKQIDLYYRVKPIRNETGEISGAMAIIEDVTKQKQMQQFVEESERKYRLLVESMNEGLVFVDKDDVILFVNDRMCEMLGYSRDEFIGKVGYDNFLSIGYKNVIIEKNKLRTQGISDRYLVQYRKKTGEKVWMEIGGAPVLDEYGNQIGSIGILTDVTARKKAEEEKEKLIAELLLSKETIEKQLIEVNKLHNELKISESNLKILNSSKDKFFTVIAQDLRAPLTGFISLTEQISQDWETMPFRNIAEISKDMFETATYLSKLLDNLLYWARSQTGRVDFAPAHYDIYDLVCNNIDEIKPYAERKNILIKNSMHKDTVSYFDLQMINTIIKNFLNNAVKYSCDGGTIKVTSKEYFDGIEVTISDSGIGISKENLDNIFNIDSTVSTNGTYKETGTGLGLILCKEFVEKHDGTLKIESELGKGSSFSFKIPIK